jgi:hypothetical protein
MCKVDKVDKQFMKCEDEGKDLPATVKKSLNDILKELQKYYKESASAISLAGKDVDSEGEKHIKD